MIKNKRDNIKGAIIEGATFASALLIIAIIVVMFTVIAIGGKDRMTWEFLTKFPEDGMTKGGIFPAIYGTAMLVIIMSIAAVPFGTITAIYLTEYAKENSIIAKNHSVCRSDTGSYSLYHLRTFRTWVFHQVCGCPDG